MSERQIREFQAQGQLLLHITNAPLMAALILRHPSKVSGHGALKELVYVKADGQRETLASADLLQCTGLIEEGSIVLHGSFSSDGKLRAGRIERALVLDALFELTELSCFIDDSRHVPESSERRREPPITAQSAARAEPSPKEPSKPAASAASAGWAEVAAASMETERAKVTREAELTWAQASEEAQAPSPAQAAQSTSRLTAALAHSTPAASTARERDERPRSLAAKRAALKKRKHEKGNKPIERRITVAPIAGKSRPPSARERADMSVVEAPFPDLLDYVDHPTMGRSQVLEVRADGTAMLLLETGKRRVVNIEVFEILEPKLDEEGNLIYPLRPNKKPR